MTAAERHLAPVERLNGSGRQPAGIELARDDALEVLAIDTEDLAFHTRVVEDVARIRLAVANDLPLIAEQLASRLLVVASRRYRQKYGSDVDLSRWGAR